MQAGFLQQLRATFRVEAEEHLQAIASGLLELERGLGREDQKAIIETVFRAAHSLKGAARAVELRDIEAACQALEEIFASWKQQKSVPTREALDGLHARIDKVAALLGGAAPAPAPAPAASAAAAPRAEQAPAAPEPPPAAAPAPVAPRGDTVRIAVDLLDERLLEAEEMLAVKLAARQRVDDLRELAHSLQAWRSEGDGRSQQERLKGVEARLAGLTRAAEQDRTSVAKLVDDLLANSKKLLLLPFSTLAASFPKMVRDLCREQGKEAELVMEGAHVELDKRILDTLKDPLLHLLRNSVDHGIEPPAERAARGKPERAEIRLAVTQLPGSQVQITLSDDGAGIDAGRVRAAAVKRGVVSAEAAAALGDEQAQALVFRSDVSTSPIVTELSGRGLGLAIVQENAARVGGQVTVESRRGAGTVFRIVVPAVRTTFRGILVQAAQALLALPTLQVDRVLRAAPEAIRTIEGRDTVAVDGRVLPVVRLAQVLEMPRDDARPDAASGVPLVILGVGDQRVAFLVDEVLDEQEFLVKPLSRPLSRVRHVASAAVLASGEIALILHVGDLLLSARGQRSVDRRPAPTEAPAPAAERPLVLVAEDSITSRMLIKATLEAAGYRVATAVDGMDALTRLRTGQFDLLVSDIEMPRLNGFDLTATVRADARLADLPVVLLTALENREDRERGVDVGASAYIVKSSFDQSTLVDAVRRLV